MTETLERLLSEFDEINTPQRGDLVEGIIIAVDSHGAVLDLGLKRDGVLPIADLNKLRTEGSINVGDRLAVMVVEPEDQDGNLVVSASQAQESGDWLRARRLMEEDRILEAAPSGFNRGGLIAPFGSLRGFIPASHLSDIPRGLDEEGRLAYLGSLVGRKMPFKVIEVDPRRRRLVLSERKAIRKWRLQQKARLIEELREGEQRRGVVTSLREFGAFVDIGGADGLIHISELSWRRVNDPGEILQVGQEIETKVIGLDAKARRIGLSLKRLTENPWEKAAFVEGQEISGSVCGICSAGVVVEVGGDLEGIMSYPNGAQPPRRGQKIMVKVRSFEPAREKLALEWIDVLDLAGMAE